jgi:hypothetical protein
MSNMSINPQSGPEPTTSILFAYRAGGLADIAISPTIGIQAGIYYSVLGYNSTVTETLNEPGATISTTTKSTISLNYIHMPIHVVFKKDMGPGRLFITAGPFLGYGINGNQKNSLHISTTVNNQTTSQDSTQTNGITFGNSSSANLLALDYGLSASVGYDLPMGLFIRAGYDLSLASLSPVSNMGTETNNCIHVTVGFMFNKVLNKPTLYFNSKNKYLPKPTNILAFP